jgi:Spy/CpxP family protein refolding chaperone
MRTVLAMIFGAALVAATPCAHAFGGPGGGGAFMRGHGEHGGPGGPPFRLLVAQLSPDQRVQVRDILRAERVQMRQIMKALHDAHEELADKSLAPGALTPADLAPTTQKIAALHQQLLDQGVQVMLKIRALATPDQLAKAQVTKQKLDALREQMRALLEPTDTPDPNDSELPE